MVVEVGRRYVNGPRRAPPSITFALTLMILAVGCATTPASTPAGVGTPSSQPNPAGRVSDNLSPDATPPSVSTGSSDPNLTPIGRPEITSTPGYQFLVAASDVAAGVTRLPFVVIGPDRAFVEEPGVSIAVFHVDEETGDTGPTVRYPTSFRTLETERSHPHEDGSTHVHLESQGVYVADAVDFDAPGVWGIRVTVPGGLATGADIEVEAFIRVAEETLTPAIGAPAPRTEQRTARDVGSLSEISTRKPPLRALYETTVAEAIDAGRPFVVAFSTPAFCQSRICGPVLEEVIEVLPDYDDRVEFIHIEPFDLAAVREGGGFTLVAAAVQWGLPTEPWVFVVDAAGRIAAKFEGIVTAPELRSAIDAVVES